MALSGNPNYFVTIMQFGSSGSTTPTITVQAPISERVDLSFHADYAPPLPQSFTSNSLANGAASLFGIKLAVQSMTAQLWNGSTPPDINLELEFFTESDPVADVQTPVLNLLKLVTPTVNSYGFMQSPGPQLDLNSLKSIAISYLSSTKSSSATSGNNTGATGNATTATMTSASTSTPTGTGNVQNTQNNSNSPGLGTASYWNSKVQNRIAVQIGNYLYFSNVVVTSVVPSIQSILDANTGLPHHVTVAFSFRPMFAVSQSDLSSIFLQSSTTKSTTSVSGSNSSLPSIISGFLS